MSPSPLGVWSGEGAVPHPQKIFDFFFYQNSGFLCILGGIICLLNVCFIRKNGAFGLPKLTYLTKILSNLETVSITEPVQNLKHAQNP